MTKKPLILVICDYYLPGYKSGGGMRTIVNMVDRLHDRFDFRVITRDHDGKLDKKSYKTVKINAWNNIQNAQVFYLSKDNITFSKLRELILEVNPDLIYFNSYFATLAIYSLTLRKLGLIPRFNVVLAPCGELSEGALQLKRTKKKFFLTGSKSAGLYDDIIWKASSTLEKKEIERFKGEGGKIFIAPDLPPKKMFENYRSELKPPKKEGQVKLVFLSRFAEKKNFKWLLENLKGIVGELSIDIWGPLEEKKYWQECQKLIRQLPPNIKIEAKGTVSHEKVFETLVDYHFFILPTLAENFGHVFLEALASGCPLIISDRTPWLELEKKGAGWDLSLLDSRRWNDIINYCIGLDQTSYSEMSANARSFVLNWLEQSDIESDTLTVLLAGLENRLAKAI